METFAMRLRKLRAERNKTLEDVATALGITKSTLSKYENNKRKPQADILSALADYFNVTSDYLLGRAEFENGNIAYDIQEDLQKVMEKYDIDYVEVVDEMKKRNIDPETAKTIIETAEKFSYLFKKDNKGD